MLDLRDTGTGSKRDGRMWYKHAKAGPLGMLQLALYGSLIYIETVSPKADYLRLVESLLKATMV